MNLDDIITYSVSLLWLVIIIGFLVAIANELIEQRRLKNTPQVHHPNQPSFPPSFRRSFIPHSYSVSSLSNVYMENDILNVTFGNSRVAHIATPHRDWTSPSAFIDRPQPSDMAHSMSDFSGYFGLSIAQIEKAAPPKIHDPQPNDDTLVCVICMEDVEPGQRKRELPCHHAFHAKCILTWVRKANRCPCCAADVVPSESIDDLSAILRIEDDEFRHFNGFRELSVTNFEERREYRPRFSGRWSFSNRRVNPAHRSRRGFWNERGITHGPRSRVRLNDFIDHRPRGSADLRNDEDPLHTGNESSGGERIFHVTAVNLDHTILESDA